MPFELPQFVEGLTEARCCIETAEPTHRIVPVFDAAVVLFDPIVQILITAMLDL